MISAADFQMVKIAQNGKTHHGPSKTLETRPFIAPLAPRSLTGDTVDQTSHKILAIDVIYGPATIAGTAVAAAEISGLKMLLY